MTNPIIVFSKAFKKQSIEALVELALQYEIDGFDLCVRPEYAVNPDNVSEKLPKAARQMADHGLQIPMLTGSFDLLAPDHPTAEPMLAAMDQADIRLVKLGYFRFDPQTQDYWHEVDRIRKFLAGWQELGNRYNVKICYHTHSHRCMGLNAAALAHLIRGYDSQYIGAYLDPGHMLVEGEEFSVGAAMVREYLSIVGLKDMSLTRGDRRGHGTATSKVLPAGQGMVDWTSVFSELKRIGFDGPLSVHCEFEAQDEVNFFDLLHNEIQFFRQQRDLMV